MACALGGREVEGEVRWSGSSGKNFFPYGTVGSFAGAVAVFEKSDPLRWREAFRGGFWFVIKITVAFGYRVDGACLFAAELMTEA